MASTTGVGIGKQIRMERLLHRHRERLFLVPMDHSVTDGPIATGDGMERLIGEIAGNGADGVVLHKGRLRFLDPRMFRALSVVVHLSASTNQAPDTDEKILVGDVEQAVRLGADAVSVHVNLGCDTEAAQLADLGRTAEHCARWGMPLLAMVYPRGPRVRDPRDPELVAHAATVAVDLGADIVKTPYTGSVETMTEVVRSCPIPLIAAGGAAVPAAPALLASIRSIMRSGAAGVAVGRNVFQARDVAGVTRSIAEIVHGPEQDAGRAKVLEHAALIRGVK
ncbi:MULTISPECIES: 2-amino-3,7-dideoxy-D-threo-hept-6-ulosonate synthase [Actinomadura]|uniref:2-amino-3,7-dideoxy-D-threo-hept-6-ulosonate synthase n=1 Tax=Actinomadura yumaensis TaxID=111807 RepID=A0ABW2CLA6_9ACTN|nr:2-amino-3,7-dideoxy-D-threo-hept-6-ulosonate synthase [Actinomadura sp. J1-007]MWK36849.1 2-amino-4,5-dihydroxy-6-one-heptanoic acid-7-phosphate synthase [Actinomadura sp. J1-007]